MPVSDVYTGRSTITLTTAATAVPIASVYGTAAKRGWIVGVRLKVGVTLAAAGNDILFQLFRPSATNTGTGLAGGVAHDFSSPASICQFASTWSTPPALGTILGEWVVPATTGSMWEEFPPGGDEWGVPAVADADANAGVHLMATLSVSTSTPVVGDLIWSE